MASLFCAPARYIIRSFIWVEVEDHGPGIAAADLPYIFDRYYRSRSDAGKQGTGLGLSITKAIFQQHGFRFGVQSTLGKGTTFWFIATDTWFIWFSCILFVPDEHLKR